MTDQFPPTQLGDDNRIVIVGAGIAGLACGRRLVEAGYHPVILDKGRGIGGRLATRRGDGGLQFDHGAQYVTAESAGLRTVLSEAEQDGAAAIWGDRSERPRYVGTPGMSALAGHLGRGLQVRRRVEVSEVRQTPKGWSVIVPGGAIKARTVVLTAPAPQIAALLDDAQPFAPALKDVAFDPCWTLMAAFVSTAPMPFERRRDPGDALAWIALDSSKPGRASQGAWIAQAGPDWSRANLELDRTDIIELLVPMLCDRLGADRSELLHVAAHRWRYARVSQALGSPFLANAERTLYAGGDWCLAARVEAAWTSGVAIAENILGDR